MGRCTIEALPFNYAESVSRALTGDLEISAGRPEDAATCSTLLGVTSFFYFICTYSCVGSKWKGEITNQEHTPGSPYVPDGASTPDFPEPIPMIAPNSKPQSWWEKEAFDIMQACGC
jgi:hypothetical protein